MLLEKVLKRLETPNICEDCVARELGSDPFLRGNPSVHDWKLRERLPVPETFQDRAIRIFKEHHDLATWQYEDCLAIIKTLGPQGYPASVNYVGESVLPLIFLDDTQAYSDKAIAFLRGSGRRPSSARAELAAKFDLVRDRDLKEYMSGFGVTIHSINCRRGMRGPRPMLSPPKRVNALREFPIHHCATRTLGSIARSHPGKACTGSRSSRWLMPSSA